MPRIPVIAIVDDDAAMREALFDLLQVADLPARTFDSAADFLSSQAAGGIDLLVTDIGMPGMDGLELQRRLRELGSSIPVILITASGGPEERQRALEEGAFAYLTKPLEHNVLLQLIHTALARDRDAP